MAKDRWIVPIGIGGRIEISIQSGTTCRIDIYDDEEPEKNSGMLTPDELSEYIHELEAAQRRLNQLEQEARKKEESFVEEALAEEA